MKISAMETRPDGDTSDPTETWAVTAYHCRRTREDGQPGEVKLILDDTNGIE